MFLVSTLISFQSKSFFRNPKHIFFNEKVFLLTKLSANFSATAVVFVDPIAVGDDLFVPSLSFSFFLFPIPSAGCCKIVLFEVDDVELVVPPPVRNGWKCSLLSREFSEVGEEMLDIAVVDDG